MSIKIAILGSTGSIGTQTLDVVQNSKNMYQVCGLSTYQNIELLEKQADLFQVKNLAVFEEEKARELQEKRKDFTVFSGLTGLIKIATLKDIDTIVSAVVGKIGIEPVLQAIKVKKNIALANKESLVVAGEKIMKAARKYNVAIRPIDSEHCAIFQALLSGEKKEVNKIILTASGGPFLDKKKYPLSKLENISVKEALNHPTWKMGKKISIDSATLANKGLEIIEAMWLFDIDPQKIEVVIHPQSIMHSAVEFVDGSVIAELGKTDMRRCISYALSGYKRIDLNLAKLSLYNTNLTFTKPDRKRFSCLLLAEKAALSGQKYCQIFNDTNEQAVQDFLQEKIKFTDIPKIIANKMNYS